MSEMVLRVAQAIRRHKFMRSGRLSVLDPTNITEEELGEARAAIEAMAEPTDAMLSAAVPLPVHLIKERNDETYTRDMNVAATVERMAFRSRWQDAIAAALKVQP